MTARTTSGSTRPSVCWEFAEHGGRRVVVAGTCAEYDWSAPGPYDEVGPIRPATGTDARRTRSPRAGGEADSRSRGRGLFFLYGPREHPDRFVPSVARALLDEQPAECTAGTQVRDSPRRRRGAGAARSCYSSDRRPGQRRVRSGCHGRGRGTADRLDRRLAGLLTDRRQADPAERAPLSSPTCRDFTRRSAFCLC